MQYRLSNKPIAELSCDYELCFVEGDKIENLEDKDVLELCKCQHHAEFTLVLRIRI